jgi:hypothetical protein
MTSNIGRLYAAHDVRKGEVDRETLDLGGEGWFFFPGLP